MDAIKLTGIKCYGYIGYLPEEQVLGQWFELDITLSLDLSKPGKTDDIADTVDYRSIIAKAKDLVKTAKFALLEKLATTIAKVILEEPQIQQVTIKLTKLAAPIPDYDGKIAVELTRSRYSAE